MKLTKREKKRIIKVACIGLDIQNASMILGMIGVIVTMYGRILDMDVFNVSIIPTCVIIAIYCLSRMIFDGYIELAEDIEDGYIR